MDISSGLDIFIGFVVFVCLSIGSCIWFLEYHNAAKKPKRINRMDRKTNVFSPDA